MLLLPLRINFQRALQPHGTSLSLSNNPPCEAWVHLGGCTSSGPTGSPISFFPFRRIVMDSRPIETRLSDKLFVTSAAHVNGTSTNYLLNYTLRYPTTVIILICNFCNVNRETFNPEISRGITQLLFISCLLCTRPLSIVFPIVNDETVLTQREKLDAMENYFR